MKFSSIISNVPDYPFAKVNRISKAAQERDGIRVINARIGIPDREAPRAFKESLTKYLLQENSTYGYPCDVHPGRGIPELVEAIIEDYRRKYGITLASENIAVTGWTKEVLHNLVRLFSQGKVLIPDPVYPAYEGATVLSGNTIERVRTSPQSRWLPEFNLSGKDAVAFYFCDPNNPTGAVAGLDYYKSLAQGMEANDVCGIFDKAYKDYVFDDETKPVSITQVPALMNRGFEVVSFSKHYNLVGVGLGWIVSSAENIDLWLKFSGHFSQGVEWYKQRAGAEALGSPAVAQEMGEYFAELRERRDLLAKGLQELGLPVEVPRATPYLWARVPESASGGDDEDFVLNKMIDQAHVAFMPGSYFGVNGKGYFRTTLFLPKGEIEEALERIHKVKSW